jgi:hypothetical protein
MNAEIKEQSKQWMHAHSPNKPENYKQMLSARKLLAAVFWDKRSTNGEFRAARDHKNVRSVLRNTTQNKRP